MSRFKRFVTVVALGGVGTASWFVGSSLVQNVQFARAVEQVELAREQLSRAEDLAGVFRAVGKAVEPSVVHLRVTKREAADERLGELRRMFPDDDLLRRFFPDRDGDGQPDLPDNFGDGSNVMQGQGSGVIVQTDGSTGWIVTNNHVAGGADSITVTLADGREITNGKVVGTDPKTDLALVRIEADRLIAAPWGDSSQLQKGDFVLAFGAPFGMVGSMTHGIVSGFNRQTGILGQLGYEEFIQTDCPINPGNSGGPLVNLRGEIIGINSAILTRTGSFQGVGFAIPSNQARSVIETLKEAGRVTRGYLGVSIFDANRDRQLAERMGVKGDGVIVATVQRDGPAVDALEPGDRVLKIDGKEIKTVNELRNTVASIQPGTESTFSVERAGKVMDVRIRIAEQPDSLVASAGAPRRAPEAAASPERAATQLGLRLADPTDDNLSRFGVEGERGAVVTAVTAGSPAAAAGIRVGDVITRIGDKVVSNASEANAALAESTSGEGVGLHVSSRDGKRFVFLARERR